MVIALDDIVQDNIRTKEESYFSKKNQTSNPPPRSIIAGQP